MRTRTPTAPQSPRCPPPAALGQASGVLHSNTNEHAPASSSEGGSVATSSGPTVLDDVGMQMKLMRVEDLNSEELEPHGRPFGRISWA